MPTDQTSAPPERLDAGMLVLRRLRPEHAEEVASAVHASLDHLRPWMPWATPEAADPRTQAARAAEAEDLWDAGTDYIYSLFTVGDDAVVGAAGLHRRAGENGIEIGYWIEASHTRRGFATAAAGALTAAALALPGVGRVEIHCDEANVASAAVPRKLGYRLDRIAEHEREAPGETGRRMVWVREADAGT